MKNKSVLQIVLFLFAWFGQNSVLSHVFLLLGFHTTQRAFGFYNTMGWQFQESFTGVTTLIGRKKKCAVLRNSTK